MAAGLVAIGVTAAFAVARTESPPFTAPPVTGQPQPTRVLVVGDSYTAGSDEGGQGAAGWPAVVAAELGQGVSLEVAAAGGSGYVATGHSDQTFTDLVSGAAGGFDLVVFFGSRNDAAPAEQVQAAATEAVTAARAASPEAGLLVIGPPWVNSSPRPAVQYASVGVEKAATAAGATFVDPLDEGWFYDRPELIGADRVHPTDEGHRYMADLILPKMRAALDELAATPGR
jgi:lysophospholipase L1-like esterase